MSIIVKQFRPPIVKPVYVAVVAAASLSTSYTAVVYTQGKDMSGFEDDFGEMVESGPPSDDIKDLLEPLAVEHTEDIVPELLTQEEDQTKEPDVEAETVAGKTHLV